MEYLKLLEGLNEANCNGRIERLSILQDKLAKDKDFRISNGITDVEDFDAEINQAQDVMDQLTSFRRSHDCLLFGDAGYIPCVRV